MSAQHWQDLPEDQIFQLVERLDTRGPRYTSYPTVPVWKREVPADAYAAALETARTNVTCNAICPGWVLTPLVQKQIDAWAARDGIPESEARVRLLSEKQPSLEFVTPEQIGDLAVYLCSPAAQQIRGAALSIDGGWTAQ